jgi:DNA-binding response OmpR family regulator
MERQNPKILLVEDDLGLASMLSDALRAWGYTAWHVESAADAEAALDPVHPDLILLDLMLPDSNGLITCAKLKARAGAPVIICSATKRKDDAALGFQLGADDFLRKPFSLDELRARIGLALRRGVSPPIDQGTQVERVGRLTIDTTRCVATVDDKVLYLTPTEYRLLAALASRANQVFSRHELAERIWGCADDGVIRSLDVHMRRLRVKLSAAADTAPNLVTRRGFGYQLVDQVDVAASR